MVVHSFWSVPKCFWDDPIIRGRAIPLNPMNRIFHSSHSYQPPYIIHIINIISPLKKKTHISSISLKKVDFKHVQHLMNIISPPKKKYMSIPFKKKNKFHISSNSRFFNPPLQPHPHLLFGLGSITGIRHPICQVVPRQPLAIPPGQDPQTQDATELGRVLGDVAKAWNKLNKLGGISPLKVGI